MTRIFNRTSMKERRQVLRRNMTRAERTLWSLLRRKQIGALRFRRQYSVGRFVLDFYCPEIKLDVEVDGESHSLPAVKEYDNERDAQLKSLGIEVIRILNEEVMEQPDYVVKRIVAIAEKIESCRTRHLSLESISAERSNTKNAN